MSSTVSISAIMNGSVWTKRTSRTRSTPSVKTKRLWLGMRTTLCTVAKVPTIVQIEQAWENSRRGQAASNDNRIVLFTQRLNQLDRALPVQL